MKVTIIQLDIEWGNPQKNIDRTEKLMQETTGRYRPEMDDNQS